MPAVADPSALANSARCFTMCVPRGMHRPLRTYLLAVFAGVDATDPSALANAARCFFSCIPPGNQLAIQNYLLTLLAGTDISNPASLANQGRCFEVCLTDGSQLDVSTYLFALMAGLSTIDPGVLANRARCFQSCIPAANQLSVQNYLLAQLAAPNSSASEIENAARCFTMCVPDMGQRALRAFILSQRATCTPPLAPNNLTIVLVTNTSISFTWSQPLSIPPVTVDRYLIKWGTASGVYTNSATVSGSTFGYSITGLTPGVGYFIAVQALSGLCESPNSAELSTTTSTTCTDGTGVANDWAARVVANGGAAPSAATKAAIADFVCGCIADGTWTKMLALNVMAPDNKVAALTPLIVGPGLSLWTDPAAGQPITLSVNGLKGASAQSGFIRTGVKTTDFANPLVTGWGLYVYTASNTGYSGGSYNETKGIILAAKSVGNTNSYNGTTAANGIVLASPGNGFYSDIRTSGTDHKLYFANSLNPHAQIGATDANAWAGPFVDNGDGMILFAINDILGSQQLNSDDEISAAVWYNAFTAANSAALFGRLQTLRTTFGGGFR